MQRLRPYFPKSRGRARVDDRRMLSGIIFINRNGLRWCDAPAEHGPPKTRCNRWKRWIACLVMLTSSWACSGQAYAFWLLITLMLTNLLLVFLPSWHGE